MAGPPFASRRLLGTSAGLRGRERVYETKEALEVDEANGITVSRRRLFYDDVAFVTLHSVSGWPGALALGLFAVLFAGLAALAVPGGRNPAVVLLAGGFAGAFALLAVARLAVTSKVVTVHGRRSTVRVSCGPLPGRGQDTFSRLCSLVREVQGRPGLLTEGAGGPAGRRSEQARTQALVAEVHFDRDASPERLRALGEVLLALQGANSWIAAMSGLDELLRGECPRQFSKAIGQTTVSETGEKRFELVQVFYEPILVWGKVPPPGGITVRAVEILAAGIPPDLGTVSSPDPVGV